MRYEGMSGKTSAHPRTSSQGHHTTAQPRRPILRFFSTIFARYSGVRRKSHNYDGKAERDKK